MEFNLYDVNEETNWDKYLMGLDKYVVSLGYRKYRQQYMSGDYTYWKVFDKKYQVGLTIYDWRKYPLHDDIKKVSVGFACMLIDIPGRCDLSVSLDIKISEFEVMSDAYYNNIINFCDGKK